MRALNRRLGVALVFAVTLVTLLAGCGGGSAKTSAAAAGTALATRTVKAGPVQVRVTPRVVDASGAQFAVELDNHEIDLKGDYAVASTLTVAGKPWPDGRWSGDGPGGHHRSGTLRFAAGGPATGPVELRLTGLPAPVTLRWTLRSG